MPEIELYLHAHKPRTDFNYVQPIGADIHDINIIPAIGDFLLQDKVALKPDIIIYNIDESDQLIMDKIKKRAESYGIMQEYVPKYTYKQRFKYIFLQIVIVEMLYQFTNDEIEYKSYQIEKGKDSLHNIVSSSANIPTVLYQVTAIITILYQVSAINRSTLYQVTAK